ncbi:MAG TPA: DUF1883 domain-containing protein [Solirubrobacteraceae bacterium]|nr:DUF1883 domain-containing protein [Solirubrobacteraceae bacterium]
MEYLFQRKIMKYLYYDLGEQQRDSCVVAHLRGSAANVILLDPLNFDRYRFHQAFEYTGGLYARTPARIQIPRDGHWYLVIDCGGHSHRVWNETIEILPADESPTARDDDATTVGANA